MADLALSLEKPVSRLTFHDVARSIAAFIRHEFRLHDTTFHRFVFGQGKLTTDQLQGGIVFYGKGKFANCHTGPYFSDLRFHAVPLTPARVREERLRDRLRAFQRHLQTRGSVQVPDATALQRQRDGSIWHAGSLATLRDAVIAHFDPLRLVVPHSMDPLARHELFRRMAAVGDEFMLVSHLSETEVDQVTRFLGALTFERPDAQ